MHLSLTNLRAVLILAFASVALFLPAAFVGIPENYDLAQHLRFAVSYHQAFASGNAFPAFGWSDNFGFGSVGIRFYPPLAHISMGLLQFATGSWYDTLWITMLAWMFIGSVGAYYFALEMMPRPWALMAAIVYIAAPYHLLQVFQAFFLSEFAAAAILPFCFLYLQRVLKESRTGDAALLAFFAALLILAHLPSAIMGAIALAVFAATHLGIWRDSSVRKVLLIAASAAAAAVATSAYWLRMVAELQWVKHNTAEYYAAGYYNYSTYFFPMFLSAGEDYFPRFLWMLDLTITATLLLFVPALIAAVRRLVSASAAPVFFPLLAVAVLSAVMTSVLSKPLWDSISLLQKLQFPFRWLSVLSFAAAMLFPAGIRFVISSARPITRKTAYPLAAIALFIFVFDTTQIVIPSAPVPRSEIARRVAEISETPGCECWWPIWAQREALSNRTEIDASGRHTEILSWQPERREFLIGPGEAANVRLALFYYPRWNLKINDTEARLGPASDGSITFAAPGQPLKVSLEFRELPAVVYSRPISLLMLALLPLIGFYGWLRNRKLTTVAAEPAPDSTHL